MFNVETFYFLFVDFLNFTLGTTRYTNTCLSTLRKILQAKYMQIY